MKSLEIRAAFLEYFQSKGHTIVPSSSLIPHLDPSLLFVNAGMVQFKSVFLGETKSTYSRAVSCQKCLRAGGKHSDLENVGHTARHHTFFEMLGNFSFGDYFKKEAMLFSWEFLTKVLKLPTEKLYVSIFEEDSEAAELWPELTGIPDKKIVSLGAKDNFWQMGDTGPCGPCSEIIIDQGEEVGCGKPECRVGCDCDRYLELWNLVFMQYNRDESGRLTSLPKPSIDTGMGLERITAVLQDKKINFDTDLFEPIMKDISVLSGFHYGSSRETDPSFRVISDHIRAAVFLLSEGLIPSNEGRGYVLRRIIRRASRHIRLLNLHEPCLYKLVDTVITLMEKTYPEIIQERKRTKKLLKIEEENFLRTIEAGMNILDDIITRVRKKGLSDIPGEEIFRLYDTFGFPLDFARDIAMDADLRIDEETFQREMELQRQRSKVIYAEPVQIKIRVEGSGYTHSQFLGYDYLETNSVIVAIFKKSEPIDELTEGDEGEVLLDKTPFYGEAGGQVGDIGTITSKDSHLKVLDTKKLNAHIVHQVRVESGTVRKGEEVSCTVDKDRRRAIMRNHTATHLLHKAIRSVLGEHVKQSGSVVDQERLRFDFTHFSAVTDEEIKCVEDIMNEKIIEDLTVKIDTMSIDEAMKTGAVALFDEKYGETVRVISIGDFSKELCGGTHCRATGEIGLSIIISEGSVASGIRRIEALTGKNAFYYLRQKNADIDSMKILLKTDRPIEKVEKLLDDMKKLEKEIQKLKTSPVRDVVTEAIKESAELNGVKIVKLRQDGLNQNELRLLADNIKERLKSGIIIVSSVIDSRAAIVCMVTKDLKNKFHAGDIVKGIFQVTGGKGGGKAELAQGGTKDIDKLDNALKSIISIVNKSVQ